MKKVLFVATVTNHINTFHIPYLKWFKEKGYEVHVASNGNNEIKYCDKHFNLNFARFPIKMQNLKVYKELKKIINDNEYDIIHCHTPVGGVLTRLAAKTARKKNNTKVIYTAHGFHFYKGAPMLNWFIYYPIEKLLSKHTDCLLTINSEDYERAKDKFKSKRIMLVNGVGVDENRLKCNMSEEEKKTLKRELGLQDSAIVLTYVAELNKNKNQIILIEMMQKLVKSNKNINLCLVGQGVLYDYYKSKITELNLQKNVILLGRRDDIGRILNITDIYVASSKREGLGLNIVEAMYFNIPTVAYDNRGHRELIENGKNGYLIKQNDNIVNEFINKITMLIENKELMEEIKTNTEGRYEKYTLKNVLKEMENIYSLYI